MLTEQIWTEPRLLPKAQHPKSWGKEEPHSFSCHAWHNCTARRFWHTSIRLPFVRSHTEALRPSGIVFAFLHRKTNKAVSFTIRWIDLSAPIPARGQPVSWEGSPQTPANFTPLERPLYLQAGVSETPSHASRWRGRVDPGRHPGQVPPRRREGLWRPHSSEADYRLRVSNRQARGFSAKGKQLITASS